MTENEKKEMKGDLESSEEKDNNLEKNEENTNEDDNKNQNLENEIEKLKKESEEYKDSWMRERAEFQNYKKRVLQDIENSKKNTIRKIMENLLNPIDNLERMSQNQKTSEELKPFLDGMEMIKKEFYSALEKDNIFKISPLNEAFDPSKMEALSSEESKEYAEETVIEVYQAGYILKNNDDEIILRPSRVKIAKPKLS